MSKNLNLCGVVMLSVIALLFVPGAQGQTAQITGSVLDPTGAVIIGASVQATNTETGISRQVQTNSTGYFVAPSLPRGLYEVLVQKSGFESVRRSNIVLDEAQVLRLDFTMALGSATQTVEVTTAPPVLETVTSNLSSVITSNKILDLPVLNRNITELTELAPTVVPVGGASFHSLPVSSASQGQMSIGGGNVVYNSYMIDSVAADNVATGNTNVFLSMDAVSEFRVVTRNAPAEYGREGGGIVLMFSKSGTDTFHGSAYEYVRNTVLNANDFFAKVAKQPRAESSLNQWGGTIGGPIVHNRTFFFFNYEGFTLDSASNVTRTVLTQAQRNGDFSTTTDSKGQPLVIYDPLTTTYNGTGYTRTAFPNAIIPPGRISPIAQTILKSLPLPNQSGIGSTGTNNFFAQGSVQQTKRIYGLKIDHNFNANQRLSVRVTRDQSHYPYGANFYGYPAEPNQDENTLTRWSTAINYTNVLSNNLLLEFHVGMNKYGINSICPSCPFDASTLGLPSSLVAQLQPKLFPVVAISGVTSFGVGQTPPFQQGNYGYTAGSTLTQTYGVHTLKYGGEFRVYQLNNTQRSSFPLTLSFDTNFTQGPSPLTSGTNIGSGIASFLLGYPGSGSSGFISGSSTYTIKYGALFLQDDWKITRKLTLNPGLRWDYEGPYTDRHNEFANFDPNATVTSNGISLTGKLFYPGTNGVPRGVRDTSWKHFAPRLGLVYQVFPQTVLRAAYGLFYLPSTAISITPGRSGFDQSTAIVNTNASINGGYYPIVNLSNPFPNGLITPAGSSRGDISGIGTSVSASSRSWATGYSQQLSASIQQELPRETKLEIGYVGNMGVSLPATQQFHYLPFSVAQQYTVAQLQAAVAYPYCSLVQPGLVCNSTTQNANLLMKYPQFTGVSAIDNWAHSTYNAGIVQVQRRFSQGLDITSNYTYSKFLDNGNVGNSGVLGGSSSVQDWGNLKAERAVSTLNLPHRFVAAVLYPLPFFQKGTRLERSLLGGWKPTGILMLQSGNPIGVTTGAGNPPYAGSRPNLIGNPKPSNQTYTHWLDSTAFSVAASETPGNSPRNLPAVRTQRYFNLDMSLLKEIPITERFQAQIAIQASNLTNTTTLGAPGSGFGSGSFGVISSDYSTPRNMQFSVRLTF